MLRSKANRGNSFQRFRDAVTETLRLYMIQIDSTLLTGLLSYIWRCMSDTQKEHYRRLDVRVQAPRNGRGYDRIAQDREWRPILQELGQLIIDLHACRCKANAPSFCFDGTCTVNSDALRNRLPSIHRLWSNHKYPREESSDNRTDGGSPTTTSSSLSYAESLMSQHRTEANAMVTPPSQLDLSELCTLMQDPGQYNPSRTNYLYSNSHPLHEPATETAADVVDRSSTFFGMAPMISPSPQEQSTCSYAIYAVPISSLQGQGVDLTWDTRHNISGTRGHQSYVDTNANATATGISSETHRFYIVPESALAGQIVGQGWSNPAYQGANGYEAMY
jgi:hypothetical protein